VAGPKKTARSKLRRAERHDRVYLRHLADKIRDARAQRGMTRNALAADSGVSLRFLAQLESGQANPSILVLRRIASAMGFAPELLLSEEPVRPDQALLLQSLKRLSGEDLMRARQLLRERFGHDAAAAAQKSYITLVGLRGAGKSTLGLRLAMHRGVPFF
jgi:XRE family aerobic/anaerobic benzoate catabolism transcriptional regulator